MREPSRFQPTKLVKELVVDLASDHMEQSRVTRVSGRKLDTAVDSLDKDGELSVNLALGASLGGIDCTNVVATGLDLDPLEGEGDIGRVAAIDFVLVPVRISEGKPELDGRVARASKVWELEVAGLDLVDGDIGELESDQGAVGALEVGVGVGVAADVQRVLVAARATSAFTFGAGLAGFENRVDDGRVFYCFCDGEPSMDNIDDGQDSQG